MEDDDECNHLRIFTEKTVKSSGTWHCQKCGKSGRDKKIFIITKDALDKLARDMDDEVGESDDSCNDDI